MKKVTIYLFLMTGMVMNNYLYTMNDTRKKPKKHRPDLRKEVLKKSITADPSKLTERYSLSPKAWNKKYYLTPLHIAAKNNDEKNITAWITEYKWPVDIQNNKGQTALHFAVQDNQGNNTLYYLPNKFTDKEIVEEIADEIVNALFMHHAKLNIINKNGDSMLHVLLKNQKNDVCKILGRYRESFFNEIKMLKDRNDNTPLHVACSNCMYMLIHNLLSKKTINAKNTQGETPLDITITLYNKLLETGKNEYAKNIYEIIKYLKDFGAIATVPYTKPSKQKLELTF